MNDDRDDILISVVIPAYNAEQYISRAIESVLKQSRGADEIIVVDDGSTDKTGEIVRGYGEKVKYIRQENAGAGAARNRGIEESSCEWISFLDSDDEWLVDNLKLQIEVLQKNAELSWVFGNFYNYIGNQQTPAHDIAKAGALPGGNDYFENFLDCYLEGFYISTDSIILKRSLFDEAGLFQTSQKRGEDTDMWLRIAYRHTQVGYVKQPGSVYHRDVAESLTKTQKNCDIITEMIDRHFKISAEFNMLDKFKICASHMLGVWIRDMLLSGHTEGLLETVKRYEDILGWRFKKEMWLRVKHPKIAPLCLSITSMTKKCVGSIIKAGGRRQKAEVDVSASGRD